MIVRGHHTGPNSLIGKIRAPQIHADICGAQCAKHATDFIGAGSDRFCMAIAVSEVSMFFFLLLSVHSIPFL